MLDNDDVKIYKPRGKVIPLFKENIITDNVTNPRNERIYNRSEENIILSKEEVDANEK